jgi:hypothetical protein
MAAERAGATRIRVCPAAVNAPAGGVWPAAASRAAASLVDAADQDRQHGQAFPGPGVHAGLAVALVLAPVDLFAPNRTRDDPRAPPCRVLDRPMGQVEVERPHRGQALAVVDPGSRGFDPSVARGPDCSGRGAQPLLPRVGDLGRQTKTVEARVMALEVGPEQIAQVVGERFQAGVIQDWLAFPQVVDQQVPDGAADQLVAVDHLLRCALPRGAQLPQRRRGVGPEHAHCVQHPVEQVGGADRGAMRVRLDVEQLQHITGGDVGDGAALGGEDQGSTVGRAARGRRGHIGIGRTQRAQLGESLRVAVLSQDVDQRPTAERGGGQPAHRGPDEIGAEGDEKRPEERVVVPPGMVSVLAQPGNRDLPPKPSGGVGAADQPPVLPGWARLGFQPVKQQSEPSLVGARVAAAARGSRGEWGAGQPRPDRYTLLAGGRPVRPSRARERPCRGHRRRRDCRGFVADDGAHEASTPNRTSRDSGR